MSDTQNKDSANSSAESSSDSVATENSQTKRSGTGVFAVMQSVGAAMLGVQSSKNKERDFTQGKASHFIIGGLIGTLIFLLVIWLLVKYLIVTS